jgi:nucleolar pre-ribosomal-associated protein 1
MYVRGFEMLDLSLCAELTLNRIEFDWLLAHFPDVGTPSQSGVLVEILYGQPVSPVDIKRALCLVIHRLLASKEDDDVCQPFFLLMGEIMRRSRVTLSPADSAGIREYVFLQTTLLDVFGEMEWFSDVLIGGSV